MVNKQSSILNHTGMGFYMGDGKLVKMSDGWNYFEWMRRRSFSYGIHANTFTERLHWLGVF